jgi:LmbE family N-acetylglucosaminyl deacetylase
MNEAQMAHSERAPRSRAAVVVAHPDDETLWCGGYILTHPEYCWWIVTLCRASDLDRSPKFNRVLKRLGAVGKMADLDDGPDQAPLSEEQLQETIVHLLSLNHYDLILTHGPKGEYTRHRRHEECSKSVVELWRSGRIETELLWLFAYEDGDGTHLPQVRADADRREILPVDVWREKQRLITEEYGYGTEGWEAKTTPREEGFWCFNSAQSAVERIASWESRS